MMTIQTLNPYSGNQIKTYELFSDNKIDACLKMSEEAFSHWKDQDLAIRTDFLERLSKTLLQNIDSYSTLMTEEMGKPITQSRAEIEKCVFLCDFYAKNAALFLSDEIIETDAKESFVSYDPMGIILGIMPWNYPFWQVLRFAIPTLTSGNTVLLKHASNVTGCALAIQELFENSGFPKGCFQTLIAEHDQIEKLISDSRIKAVSLTGSEKAGKHIAEVAGKNLKKTVLELGGNNACIILKDANLNKYMDTIVNARMQNTGQSCIAAKRFIVMASVYDEFIERFTEKIKDLKYGNPKDKSTTISTLARVDLAETLKEQIDESVKKGGKILIGNNQDKAFFEPTIITNVEPGMPVFDDETFGPIVAITKVNTEKEAYKLASKTKYGLGTMVFTENTEKALKQSSKISDGAFFINELVKSDPRLPFGGTKASGYGRELSREGIHEFVNRKTIYINK
ncbi:NAD-dependent succinate-semialdehyde dehydrogenase [Hanstruepera ponticola]|uniref:NAD-dependent succinate-semialdehyde dehydrogenase n=1 Tax=Hanstruepera ponticola TaxID=2042995 RepID=UPI00293BF884|nr:NAD-dependent succinate-semialdehyde dehydrogenase [Hanstruepera ponticola]